MDRHRERAILLVRQGRLELAVEELRAGLRERPGDGFLHALLAVCLSDLKRPVEALEEARRALGAEPELAYAHYAHAVVLLEQDRAPEAEAAAREAVRLDPYHPGYHATVAETLVARERWAEALEAADRGLDADPEDVRCANLRATALVQLGRGGEAAETLDAALARDPENPATHANRGWALLHRGEPRRAMGSFREALRLHPGDAWARQGLVEALKARNPLYAGMLRYFLWMSRLPPGAQWGVIIGGALFFRVLRAGNGAGEESSPVFGVLVAAYILFVLFSWTADAVFNLVLLLDPLGRHALSPDQRSGALAMGAALLLALASWAALGAALFHLPLGEWVESALTAALLGTGLLVTVAATFRVPPGRARNAMVGLTALLYLSAGAAVVSAGRGYEGEGEWLAFLAATLLGVLASSWIGTFLTLRR